jgi:hypothetical protein
LQRCTERGFQIGIPLTLTPGGSKNRFLVCVTERNDRQSMDRLIHVLQDLGKELS